MLRGGLAGWGSVHIAIKLLGGTLALWLCWVAIFQAKRVGINYMLSIFVLVWIADIAAYFAGKAFGRLKLAPSLSPSKSWEGVWGGTCAVWVLAIVWVWADQMAMFDSPSIYSLLYAHGWVYFLVSITFLTAMSVVGDLVESMVKRSAGVKDSSQLLPGHGGVLDRVDALLPTLPLAMMLSQFVI
jgi:phosphatidate cytidylyltransferase